MSSPTTNVPVIASLVSEQAIIAIGVRCKDSFFEACRLITPPMFYSSANKVLWELILEAYSDGKDLDFVSLAERVTQGRLAVKIDPAAVYEIGRIVVATSAVLTHAENIREMYATRTLFNLSASINQRILAKSDSTSELLTDAEMKLFSLQETLIGVSDESGGSADKLLPKYVDVLEERMRKGGLQGETTGIRGLDQATKGMQKGQFILIGGRPSMGKSSLLFSIIALRLRIAFMEKQTDMKPMLIFSLEMPYEQVYDRIVSILANVSLTKLGATSELDDEEWARISEAMNVIKEGPELIIMEEGVTPMEMASITRIYMREYGGLSMIGVDYIQLMTVPGLEKDRNLLVGEVSRSLKSMAKEFKLPVVALSQLSREVDKRPDRRPNKADLRDSGSLEQDADLILFPYRPSVYFDEERDDQALIIIGKQRNGPLHEVPVRWEGQYASYSDDLTRSFSVD